MAVGDRQAEDFVFSQTTVDDIVAAAGASRRTFFRYFESKARPNRAAGGQLRGDSGGGDRVLPREGAAGGVCSGTWCG